MNISYSNNTLYLHLPDWTEVEWNKEDNKLVRKFERILNEHGVGSLNSEQLDEFMDEMGYSQN